MKRPSLKKEFDRFFSCLNEYTDLLLKIHEAREVIVPPEHAKEIIKEVLLSEKKHIHEAVVLKIYVAWEVLVESVFVDCLRRDPSQYAQRKGIELPQRLSGDVSRGLISGLGYFDFKNVGDLKGKAKRFLAARHNPFAAIPAHTANRIDEFCVIRNYLAHYSASSKDALTRMYRDNYGVPFREPGDFFFESDRQSRQLRFATYVNAFMDAAKEMAISLDLY